MRTNLASFIIKAAAVYAGYKMYDYLTTPVVHADRGLSSEAPHDAVDPAEEASMDSFPASDPPAANVFN
jgi:hypothetical protein